MAEANVREYYKKTVYLRDTENIEITFDEIYERIKEVYNLSDEQINELKRLELEGEYLNSAPYGENIEFLKELLDRDEDVILISDMYLPRDFIDILLEKADPVLTTLPFFLSNESGLMKSNKKLYIKAFHDINYRYGGWIHFGDNEFADIKRPMTLGIEPVLHEICKFGEYEECIAEKINTYDSYLVAAMMARFTDERKSESDIFAYKYVSLYLVPYISWVLKDAVKKGFETLYFISRDGYHLKRIADTMIDVKGYDIKTEYLYGSRKTWRIPSQVNELDEDFFTGHGNFAGVSNFKSLLKALEMDEEKFDELFPFLRDYKLMGRYSKKKVKELNSIFSQSEAFKEHMLLVAAQKRQIVIDYIRQEVDAGESFAFVEFWGRGYTQDCFQRLISSAKGEEAEVPFYYFRSIYPTRGNSVRYNYTVNNVSVIFIEAIFANLHYKSISEFTRENGKIEPVIEKVDHDPDIQNSLEEYLPQFCRDFYSLEFMDEDTIERQLQDFGLKYYDENFEDVIIMGNVAKLKDSVELNSKAIEYAPKITARAVARKFFKDEPFRTRSVKMSLARSSQFSQRLYTYYKAHIKNKRLHKRYKRLVADWNKFFNTLKAKNK